MVYKDDQYKAKSDETNTTEVSQFNGPLYSAKEHDVKFDPNEYLEGFYSTHKDDGAMQMVLFFLPGMLYRLPEQIETFLDLGAGPTVYIPITVRHRVKNIFTSDYSERNRQMLIEWIENRSKFNWLNICNWLSSIEASAETPEKMQQIAREKVKAVLEVNVHKDETIQGIAYKVDKTIEVPQQFDVVTTIFCLEYASETLDEYRLAVKNAVKLIKPGGYLLQGGVLHADEYCFGGIRFKCHYLTNEQIIDTLKENSMCTDPDSNDFRLIISGEVFLFYSKKM